MDPLSPNPEQVHQSEASRHATDHKPDGQQQPPTVPQSLPLVPAEEFTAGDLLTEETGDGLPLNLDETPTDTSSPSVHNKAFVSSPKEGDDIAPMAPKSDNSFRGLEDETADGLLVSSTILGNEDDDDLTQEGNSTLRNISDFEDFGNRYSGYPVEEARLEPHEESRYVLSEDNPFETPAKLSRVDVIPEDPEEMKGSGSTDSEYEMIGRPSEAASSTLMRFEDTTLDLLKGDMVDNDDQEEIEDFAKLEKTLLSQGSDGSPLEDKKEPKFEKSTQEKEAHDNSSTTEGLWPAGADVAPLETVAVGGDTRIRHEDEEINNEDEDGEDVYDEGETEEEEEERQAIQSSPAAPAEASSSSFPTAAEFRSVQGTPSVAVPDLGPAFERQPKKEESRHESSEPSSSRVSFQPSSSAPKTIPAAPSFSSSKPNMDEALVRTAAAGDCPWSWGMYFVGGHLILDLLVNCILSLIAPVCIRCMSCR